MAKAGPSLPWVVPCLGLVCQPTVTCPRRTSTVLWSVWHQNRSWNSLRRDSSSSWHMSVPSHCKKPFLIKVPSLHQKNWRDGEIYWCCNPSGPRLPASGSDWLRRVTWWFWVSFCAQTQVNWDLHLSLLGSESFSISKSIDWHDGLEFLVFRLCYGGSIPPSKASSVWFLLVVIMTGPQVPGPSCSILCLSWLTAYHQSQKPHTSLISVAPNPITWQHFKN